MKQFEDLKKWFKENKRFLPWRDNPSPYAVWISEIMLQQTQVSVVIAYYNRWMALFPSIEALASAPLEAVIKAWEGLGYYSRARNLHAGAQYIVKMHLGQLPSNPEALQKIKGIGPYTVGAIRSFAFHQKAAAVDGNVIRVLTRYFNISEDISQPKTIKTIWSLAEEILPAEEPWELVEGLIELGATICSKKPSCKECPLKSTCKGYIQGDATSLPFKSVKTPSQKIFRAVALIISEKSEILVKKVQKGKIMSDLHEFPYFETSSKRIENEVFITQIKQELGLIVSFVDSLPVVKHSFTKYQASLFPIVFKCTKSKDVMEYQWMFPEELDRIAFSAGHRRLKDKILSKI